MGRKDKIDQRAAAGMATRSGGGKGGKAANEEWKVAAKQKRKGDASAYKKNWTAFNDQLRGLGLTLRTIGSDGNCLFRSIADQMCGRQDDHMIYREQIVNYQLRHPLDFAPFVFDETFDQYCAKMKKNGCWGGAAELAAASRCFGCHITVHQYNAPRLENIYDPNAVTPDDEHSPEPPIPISRDTKTIHISYHDAEHYSSVRNISDAHSLDAATPIIIPTIPLTRTNGASSSSSSSSSSSPLTDQELIVTQSTSCSNLCKIRKLLKEQWNDPNVVVEILYAEQHMGLDIDIDYDLLQEQQAAIIEKEAAEARDKEQNKKEQDRAAASTAAAESIRPQQADQSAPSPQESCSSVVTDRAPALDSGVVADSTCDSVSSGADSDSSQLTAAAATATPAPTVAPTNSSSPTSASSPHAPPHSHAHPAHTAQSQPKSAVKKVRGRDKRMAEKQAKILIDKQKRANKAATKKDKEATARSIEEQEEKTLSADLGAVRI